MMRLAPIPQNIAELERLQKEYDEARANAQRVLERHGMASPELRAADWAVTVAGDRIRTHHNHAGTSRIRRRGAHTRNDGRC